MSGPRTWPEPGPQPVPLSPARRPCPLGEHRAVCLVTLPFWPRAVGPHFVPSPGWRESGQRAERAQRTGPTPRCPGRAFPLRQGSGGSGDTSFAPGQGEVCGVRDPRPSPTCRGPALPSTSSWPWPARQQRPSPCPLPPAGPSQRLPLLPSRVPNGPRLSGLCPALGRTYRLMGRG